MGREFRFRPSGMIFYIILLLNLLGSEAGTDLIQALLSDVDVNRGVAAIVSTGILLFTSDSIGYLFNSAVFFIFRLWGGYSRDYRTRLGYRNFKQAIIDQYTALEESTEGHWQHKQFEQQWGKYNEEVFMAYFFWHQVGHKNPLDDWHVRRWSAYMTGMTTVLGIAAGLIFSSVFILAFQLNFSVCNAIIGAISLGMMAILWANASQARKQAWQIVDLWLAGILNPQVRSIRNGFRKGVMEDLSKDEPIHRTESS